MIKHTLIVTILMFSLITFGFDNVVFAAPPSGGYTPGETLDPDCAPNDSDCIVKSLWSLNGDDVYYNTGSVGIGTNTPHASSILHLSSTTLGFLVPRMTEAERDAIISPTNGLLVYNTDTDNFNFFDGASWELVGGGPIVLGSSGTTLYTPSLGAGEGSFDNIILGPDAGVDTEAGGVNFFGFEAGYGAIDANNSNFLGVSAGYEATDAEFSNFLGFSAGHRAANAFSANFIGDNAGTDATDAAQSNFFGKNAGRNATYASDSNFIGTSAGLGATNAAYSNFFGLFAGNDATDAIYSNFMGSDAGVQATNASNSNFFGYGAGNLATNANNSNFFGESAGFGATNANHSNFFGGDAGSGAVDAYSSNFFGRYAGRNSNAIYSNFFGESAGDGATNASNSNFFGFEAGFNATNVEISNFFGIRSGYEATDADISNFFGDSAGYQATNASNSNFFGQQSGDNATNASNSNFFGPQAGYNATNASNSNFFGKTAGLDATNANNSNFFGESAGFGATNANNSTFIGYFSGSGAADASNSIFIGNNAGQSDIVDNAGDSYSILIGNQTSTGGYSNSIALGQGAINTGSNEFMIGSEASPIDSTRINGTATTQCTITTGTGIACTSDERLKDNITDIQNGVLTKLNQLRTVTYTWLGDRNSTEQVGFLAQQLETFFPQIVATDKEGFKSVFYSQMTPILTKAIQELSVVVSGIFETLTTQRVETEELCVGSTCITEEQFMEVFGASSSSHTIQSDKVIDQSDQESGNFSEKEEHIEPVLNELSEQKNISQSVEDEMKIDASKKEEAISDVETKQDDTQTTEQVSEKEPSTVTTEKTEE